MKSGKICSVTDLIRKKCLGDLGKKYHENLGGNHKCEVGLQSIPFSVSIQIISWTKFPTVKMKIRQAAEVAEQMMTLHNQRMAKLPDTKSDQKTSWAKVNSQYRWTSFGSNPICQQTVDTIASSFKPCRKRGICGIIIKWTNKECEIVYDENWQKMTNSEFECFKHVLILVSIKLGVSRENRCGARSTSCCC